jgi:hypothetical protein
MRPKLDWSSAGRQRPSWLIGVRLAVGAWALAVLVVAVIEFFTPPEQRVGFSEIMTFVIGHLYGVRASGVLLVVWGAASLVAKRVSFLGVTAAAGLCLVDAFIIVAGVYSLPWMTQFLRIAPGWVLIVLCLLGCIVHAVAWTTRYWWMELLGWPLVAFGVCAMQFALAGARLW